MLKISGPSEVQADSDASGDATAQQALHRDQWRVQPQPGTVPKTPELHEFNSPSYPKDQTDKTMTAVRQEDVDEVRPIDEKKAEENDSERHEHDIESLGHAMSVPHSPHPDDHEHHMGPSVYTHNLRHGPIKTYIETLKPWNGRLRKDNWLRAMVRPFILFAYPAILWSALVYSLSVGWLIVLSESVSVVYRNPQTYNFNALQTGLVYISPFVGGILGTAVAGKVSDIVVRFMARRNDGVYEPEFRLVMAIPVMLSTCIGLMGFGWSAQLHDAWIVPTVLFGVISFGCSLGSTTAITFAVDSYRMYAGEALVTLNFSKSKSIFVLCPHLRSRVLIRCRRLPRPRLLPLLHRLARVGRLEDGVQHHWRHPGRLPAFHDTHVHLRQASSHVDRAPEHDGEVVRDASGLALHAGR